MESRKVRYLKGLDILVGTFTNDVFSSKLRVVVFGYDKINNKAFRRICGVKDFEYPTEYRCYGVTVEDSDDNMDTIFLQKTEEGAIFADVADHEVTHCVLNIHARLHQDVLTGPGQDEFTASLHGCIFNLVYSMLVKYKIPMIVG